MINRHSITVILVSAVISAGILLFALNRSHSKKQEPVSTRVFKGQDGWGYDILVDDTVYIHQEYIPVIATKKGFAEKQQAEKAAGLVLQKIQQNKIPSLTKLDIDNICSPAN